MEDTQQQPADIQQQADIQQHAADHQFDLEIKEALETLDISAAEADLNPTPYKRSPIYALTF